MKSKVLFASVAYERYEADCTLPAKFDRLLESTELAEKVKGRHTAVKMHLGRNIGFTTIHPLFIKKLIDKLLAWGAKPYITDQTTDGARYRGYTEDFLGCKVVDTNGVLGKYYYEKYVDFKTFKNVDISGHIHDAEFMIDLSHAKGHGACGFGGACKNIAMGCVTDRTRGQIHALEGGITWDENKCIHCDQCVKSCNHYANEFVDGKYEVNFHHCTYCQHCVKVCPNEALVMDANHYHDFQTGMALCTKTVLDTFDKDSVYYINFLTNITALCDCWGLSTPSLVPDIGIMASSDIVAIERASVDAIKFEDLLPNSTPKGVELGTKGHLFERLHGVEPYTQINELEKAGLGSQEYAFEDIS